MVDLSTNCAGIKSPNPFWLASAPPANSGEQVMRAFEYGWGGAVWKTLGQDPPVINVTSRYGAMDIGGQKIAGLNNVELITDRPLDDNLKEIYAVKKRFPKHAVVASLMVPCERQPWHDIVKKVEDAGCDGLELNFGCPHGMSERGMGAAVGQVPEYIQKVTEFVKEVAKTPVLVKLTPNITDVRYPARAAKEGGADGVSLINTINSVMGVDLKTLEPKFGIGGKAAHGGYCGPAVKPIALNMISQIANDKPTRGLPISGIGGISTWEDAVEFMLLGSSSVQLCTAVMHYGYRIIEDLTDGLENWMEERGFNKLDDFIGKTAPNIVDWKHLNLHHKTVASIDKDKCIECDLCYVACNDTAHQCIEIPRDAKGQPFRIGAKNGATQGTTNGHVKTRVPKIIEEDCVGCNLCSLVCPVDNCITMKTVDTGHEPFTWEQYLKNDMKGYKEVYKRMHS
jgi:dihydropyrimidine dehydrogenase (NAD+) subunit PreA